MEKETITTIDSNYILLENLTNKDRAKDLFKDYLLGVNLGGDVNETKVKICFREVSRYEIVSQIAKFALIYTCQNENIPRSEVFDSFKNQLFDLKIGYSEVVDYLYENLSLLEVLIDEYVAKKFNNKEHYKLDYNVNNRDVKKYIIHLESSGKSDFKPSLVGRVRNIVFNKTRQDILANKQVKINNKKYALGKELYATVDRGNNSLAQEDGVLLIKHPNEKNFKMIAVADGESSMFFGEKASNYALSTLLNWFESLDGSYYHKMKDLKKLLENQLIKINSNLADNEHVEATTIAVAIVGYSDSIISTIGDSRIYFIKDNKVVDETRDDSYVNTLCDNGLADPKTKRFHKAINILYNQLGTVKDLKVISNNTKVVPNDYDKLIILSDGVTRLVDNDRIEKILDENKDRENTITDELVNVAKKEDSYLEGTDLYCDSKIEANQENMTAAMFIKRR